MTTPSETPDDLTPQEPPPPETEVVRIENKNGRVVDYETVPSRLNKFRHMYPGANIRSELIEQNAEKVIMKVALELKFESGEWHEISSAYAEEVRFSSDINTTSAMENCETSALGRALAFAGFGGVKTIASAEEVIGARQKQAVIEERAPGAVAILTEAARGGKAALRAAYIEMSEADRMSAQKYMPKLKRDATAVGP